MARSSLRDLRRRGPARRPRLRILLVSEGAKTEGIYLSLFVRDLGAANVQVDIMGRECGSDPLSVAEFARSKFKADTGYDLCYCIIDRDSHDLARFNSAIELANSVDAKSGRREFVMILSDPCIEFWFLLHFTYSRSPFVSQGVKSRADCAMDELKKYLPDYKKASREAMSKIIPFTEKAIGNSIKALNDARTTGDPNPSSTMHIMIERLLLESKLPE